jgi:hypothetical protein
VTPTDAMYIGAFLAGCSIGGALILARGRSRYQGPASEPYGGFQTGAHTGTGEFLQLDCEGHCPGTTKHEVTGDEGATCVLCGTARPIPVPDGDDSGAEG